MDFVITCWNGPCSAGARTVCASPGHCPSCSTGCSNRDCHSFYFSKWEGYRSRLETFPKRLRGVFAGRAVARPRCNGHLWLCMSFKDSPSGGGALFQLCIFKEMIVYNKGGGTHRGMPQASESTTALKDYSVLGANQLIITIIS